MQSINESGISPLEYFVVIKPDDVENKTKGGIYIPDDRMIEFPDIILIKKDKRGVPIELKTGALNRYARPKALHQLENGRDFIRSELGLQCDYGKLVFTTRRGGLGFEVVNYTW